MENKLKPTDIDIENIANAYCRLQMGVEKCGECTGYKNGVYVDNEMSRYNIIGPWEE